jgi:hypothetical protein
VHTFDASSHAPYQRYIPAMRTAQDTVGGGGTNTPIYDALYSEYRRLFRTLPGDRSGEESLQFNGFAAWNAQYPPFAPGGRHRGGGGGSGGHGGNGGGGPAALPPGRGDNRMP